MAFDLQSVLKMLTVIPAATAALPEFVAVFNQIVGTFKTPADQSTLRGALADLRAENDEGFKRLQAKLEAAARR